VSAVVLLRAVPDPEASDPSASLLLDAASLVALGQALAWRNGGNGARLIGLAAGPPAWEPALREAIALGVDEVRRVWSAGFAAANDAVATAAALAGAMPADAALVFAGPPAGDHGSGALAGALAEVAGWPLLAEVTAVEARDGSVLARVKEKASRRRTYRVDGPAVLVAAQVPPPPLYPPLARRLAARNAAIAETTPTAGPTFGRLRTQLVDGAAGRFEVVGYGPARPRTRHLLQPDASANAGDRLRSLMGGGMAARGGSASALRSEGASVTKQLVDLLAKEGLLEQL